MVFDLDVITAAKQDFDKVCVHEMTHAVVHDALGIDGRTLSPWFDEGVAIYEAGDGERWVKDALRHVRLDPEAAVCDFEGPIRAQGYPQYFLAVSALVERVGLPGLRRVIQGIRNGQTAEEAIAEVSGLDWSLFREYVRSSSLKRMNDIKSHMTP